MSDTICLLGLGEVGAILAEDLRGRARLCVWDRQCPDPGGKPARTAARLGLDVGASAADAVADADIVISAVTAAQTVHAAREAASGLQPGAIFLDLNSASPGAKSAAAAAIHDARAFYVEVAVMSPFPPKRLATPMLLGGPHAEAFTPQAHALGFSSAQFFSPALGQAAAAKLCRSVMVKGIEALLCESLLAARHYDVEDVVLRSLDDLFPGPDWPRLSRYMIGRAVEHGARRAEEMREAARTVAEAGLDPRMSEAVAELQAWASDAGRRSPNLTQRLDSLLSFPTP